METQTHPVGQKPWAEGTNGRQVASSQGTPGVMDARKILPETSRGARPCPHLDCGLPANRTMGNKFLLFKATRV